LGPGAQNGVAGTRLIDDRDPYVLVLVDGEGYLVYLPSPFRRNTYLHSNYRSLYDHSTNKIILHSQPNPTFLNHNPRNEGGKKAAEWLHQAIDKYLRDKHVCFSRIVVRIYGDVGGMANSLALEKEQVREFLGGFITAKPLFDFLPVVKREGGPGAMGTREKIGGEYRLT
jgi:hypothetical protein